MILAALLTGPGWLLALFQDTGDIGRAIQTAFPSLSSAAAWMTAFVATFSIGVYALIFFMIRYARRLLAAASRDIVPLLPDGEAGFRRIYGVLHSPFGPRYPKDVPLGIVGSRAFRAVNFP